MALPLTSGIGTPPLLLTPLFVAAVFGSLSVRMQAKLIRYLLRGLFLVSATHSLPLTIYIYLSQVRRSITAVTDTVGFRALIASRADLDLLVPLLPSVCMTCQWRLDAFTLSWSTTVMITKPLAANNRMRVGPIPNALTTRTKYDRSMLWHNTSNPSKSRIWQEYRDI